MAQGTTQNTRSPTPTVTAPASPFTPVTVFGKYDPSRTSNFGFAYANDTVPTPWPYLAASLVLSIVLAYFSIGMEIFHEKKQNRRKQKGLPIEPRRTWGKAKAAVSGGAIAIGLIRSVSLLISTAKAEAGTGGRYSSPSVLLILFLSIFVVGCDPTIPHPSIYLLIWLELACVFVSIVITGYRGYFFRTPKRSYGKFFPSGGICPQLVDSCNDFDSDELGCDPAFDHVTNASAVWPSFDELSLDADYVVVADLVLTVFIHLLAFAFFVIVVGALAGLIKHPDWLKPLRFDRNVNYYDFNPDPSAPASDAQHGGSKTIPTTAVHSVHVDEAQTSTVPTSRRKKKETVYDRFNCLICLMFIFAAATFTVHFLQETRPKAFYFTDGSGPIGLKRSWSDCFQTSAPNNNHGFWDVWSKAQKGEIENLLAFV